MEAIARRKGVILNKTGKAFMCVRTLSCMHTIIIYFIFYPCSAILCGLSKTFVHHAWSSAVPQPEVDTGSSGEIFRTATPEGKSQRKPKRERVLEEHTGP